MKKVVLIIIVAALFTSCADVLNVDNCTTPDPYGFWSGIWHGWIILTSFIGSLFSNDIAIYAVNNNGFWYDFGFIFGIGGFSNGVTYVTKRIS